LIDEAVVGSAGLGPHGAVQAEGTLCAGFPLRASAPQAATGIEAKGVASSGGVRGHGRAGLRARERSPVGVAGRVNEVAGRATMSRACSRISALLRSG